MSEERLQQTKRFAIENRLLSWWYLLSTLLFAFCCAFLILQFESLWSRIPLSIVMGLLLVRLFILFHDFYHKALFEHSVIAQGFFWVYGLLTFTPASVWKETHNFHHAHNSAPGFSNIGSFHIMTLAEWQAANARQKFFYRLERSPITILFGYFTVFFLGMCVQGFLRKPSKNWDALLSIIIGVGIAAAAYYWGRFADYFYVWLLPSMIGAAVGSYLFYAQHNFPDMKIASRKDWSYFNAAVDSTSFIKMPAILHWFTGNIGYHPVHHANHRIPFYRLPEAMKEIPEFQTPKTTSLHPKAIWSCLQLVVWDTQQEKMLTQRELGTQP